jgi:hypothetical protein
MKPSRSIRAREAGLALVSRVNRWLITGAVVATGAVSVAAARSFHGDTSSQSTSQVQTRQSESSGSSSASAVSGSGGLQQPAQAPSSSASSRSAATSGGS